MKVEREDIGDVVVLRLHGRLMGEADERDAIGDAIKKAIADGKLKVILDLHEVPYLNSTGLGVLVQNYSRLKREGGVLRFLRPTSRVKSLFPVVAPLFKYYEDETVALTSFDDAD